MSDGTEQHRQDAVDGIEDSIYCTYEMSNVGYVNKVAQLKWQVIHVLHKDAVDDIEYSIYIYI